MSGAPSDPVPADSTAGGAADPAAHGGAVDLVTFGESMVLLQPLQDGPLPYAPLFVRSIAGAESNVAIALTRLGKRARWISRLGVDPFGDIVAGALAGEGVDITLVVRDPDAPTAVFFREFRSYGDPNVYYYRSGSAASRLSPEDVRPEWFTDARWLHVTGITPALGPAAEGAVAAAMRMAHARGLAVSFDPNLRRKLWTEDRSRRALLALLPLCDVFLPGEEEAEFLLGARRPEEYGPAFLDQGPRIVALKLGERGSMGFARGCAVEAPPFPISRVVDTIGAGDAFAAGFLSILLDQPPSLLLDGPESVPRDDLQGVPGAEAPPTGAAEERLRTVLTAALERANLMGALATQFRGDWEGLPSLAELERIRSGRRRITR